MGAIMYRKWTHVFMKIIYKKSSILGNIYIYHNLHRKWMQEFQNIIWQNPFIMLYNYVLKMNTCVFENRMAKSFIFQDICTIYYNIQKINACICKKNYMAAMNWLFEFSLFFLPRHITFGITMMPWWPRWRLKSPVSRLFTQTFV